MECFHLCCGERFGHRDEFVDTTEIEVVCLGIVRLVTIFVNMLANWRATRLDDMRTVSFLEIFHTESNGVEY